MELKKLIYTVEDGVAVVTMNYMKNLNAIDFRGTKSIIDNRCCAMWISYYAAEQGGKENAAQV